MTSEVSPSVLTNSSVAEENSGFRFTWQEITRFLLALWILAIFLLPATPFQILSPANALVTAFEQFSFIAQSTAVVGFVVLVVALLFVQSRGSRYNEWKLLLTALVVTYLTTLCLAVWGARQMPPMVERLTALVLFLVAGLLTSVICPKPLLMTVAVVLVATVQAGYALVYYCKGINLFLSGSTNRAMGTFDTPNHLYPLLLIALPLTLVLTLTARSIIMRFLITIGASLQFSAFILTWFRGGIVAFIISSVFLIGTLTRSRRLVVLVFLALLPLVFTTWMVRGNGLTNRVSLSGSDTGHLHLMEQGLKVFVAHPLVGVGVANLRINTDRNNPKILTNGEPKNLYLYYLAELGIAGAALLLGFGLCAVKVLRPLISHYPLMAGVASAWIAFTVVGLFDTPFGSTQRTVGDFCFGFLVGMTIFAPELSKLEKAGEAGKQEKATSHNKKGMRAAPMKM